VHGSALPVCIDSSRSPPSWNSLATGNGLRGGSRAVSEIQASPLTIRRDPQTGLPDITRAGAVETDLDVSQFAEPERFTVIFAGQLLYQATYTRDALGRITTSRSSSPANPARSSTTTTTPIASHPSTSLASPPGDAGGEGDTPAE
jgi:hypothetical protein